MIRRMNLRDLDQVAALEQECFSGSWSRALLMEGLKNRLDFYWVLEQDGRILAYCDLRVIAGEGEIQRIAVSPEARGKGYGKELMGVMTDFSKNQGVTQMVLEVRKSNAAAIGLYKTYGFEEEAVRKNYYRNPDEDAVLMRLREI